jgi:hypothetical protein
LGVVVNKMKPLLVLATLTAALVVAGGIVRGDQRDSATYPPAPPGGASAVAVREAALGTEPHRRVLIGTLVQASASGMTLETENAERVFVRFADETRFCRRGCGEGWRHLRPGDRITALAVVGLGEPVRVADWVDANLTAGYGTVVSVDDDVLSVVLIRPERPAMQRVLLLGPYTSVKGPGGRIFDAGRIEAGDSFYFTGSGETPGATEIWVYVLWGDF